MLLLVFIICLLASVVGAICGIGGGIVIKPSLDFFFFGKMSVSAVSFLSGCTVLSMTCYTVGHSFYEGKNTIDLKIASLLAVGAILGGIGGKELFAIVQNRFSNQDTVGAVQAVCLFAVTFATLLYIIRKKHIRTRRISSPPLLAAIGLCLGLMSSFLGIGGGPINLVVLSYFFSMDTKTAALNSLCVILFSQAAYVATMLLTRATPDFEWTILALMISGGICGGIIGRIFNRRLDNHAVEKLFISLLCFILFICVYNTWKFSGFRF